MASIDLYGWGPLLKGVALAYLCYMTVFNDTNVPIGFFILYGVGSAAFITHLFAIKDKSIVDAGIYEQYANIILCAVATLFILRKTKVL